MSVEGNLRVRLQVVDESGAVLQNFESKVAGTVERTQRAGVGITSILGQVGRLGATAAIAYDRLSIATLAVENAQTRQAMAQDRLQRAIERYGAGSREANMAQQELEISTRGLEIAQQRYWVRIAFGVGVIIPDLIRGTQKMIEILNVSTFATNVATVATNRLTAARVAALVATGVGIPLAIAGGIALAGALTAVPDQPSAMNVYGDINVGGVSSPADFARQMGEQARVQGARTARP